MYTRIEDVPAGTEELFARLDKIGTFFFRSAQSLRLECMTRVRWRGTKNVLTAEKNDIRKCCVMVDIIGGTPETKTLLKKLEAVLKEITELARNSYNPVIFHTKTAQSSMRGENVGRIIVQSEGSPTSRKSPEAYHSE